MHYNLIPFKHSTIHHDFKKLSFSLFILFASLLLALVKNQIVFVQTGGWDMLFYLLMFTPLAYISINKKVQNPYTPILLGIISIWIIDLFYYNNDFIKTLLPIMIFFFTMILYLTSMHKVTHFYQVLLPRFYLPFNFLTYIKEFMAGLISIKYDRSILKRIGIALFITLPFIALFLSLFTAADAQFLEAIKSLILTPKDLPLLHIITTPLYFFGYLTLFVYSLSNTMIRKETTNTKAFDLLIVGIFLGLINALFISFLLFQLPALFDTKNYLLSSGINLATYAREGFFQLMWVMGIVMMVSLFVVRRYKGERMISFMMSALMLQSMLMGFSSLKKIYLYQELKGATVLRYYVEWIDYALLLILAIGVFSLLKKLSFHQLLNAVVAILLIAVTIVASINVDYLVASHNLKQFQDRPKALDKKMISRLSIDALGAVQKSDIPIYIHIGNMRECESFTTYHPGYCSKIQTYGKGHITNEWK